MEEPKTEEYLRWIERSKLTNSQNTADVISTYVPVSDENQSTLKDPGSVDLSIAKQNSGNSNPQEKSWKNIKSYGHSHGLSGVAPPGPSPSLLALLHSLVEDNDHMLLPHSLHQIAEAYFLEEDYHWAVEFLHLEKLYHERLLYNLACIQEKWESQWKAGLQTKSHFPLDANGTDRESKHMESLSHICRTHQRPNLSAEKNMCDTKPPNRLTHVTEHRGLKQERALEYSARRVRVDDCSWLEAEQEPEENCEANEEEEGLEEDEFWNEDLEEQTEIDGQVSADELAKLIQIEEMYPSDGLVSILKKRKCINGTQNLNPAPQKDSTKRKVRFREPDDAFEQDESTRTSCLILLLLCLVTVVISMGGTALYCLIGEAYSNVCVDFSQNMDFYFGPVYRGVTILSQWLSSDTS